MFKCINASFALLCPGASNTVAWCIKHSGLVHRTQWPGASNTVAWCSKHSGLVHKTQWPGA